MLSGLENGCIQAQAPKIAEPNHNQQIDRVRGNDVLVKEHCLYERDRRLRCEDEMTLCVSVHCAGCYFFSPKLTKTSSIRDRLLLTSKRSSLSLYRLRDKGKKVKVSYLTSMAKQAKTAFLHGPTGDV